ncbi:serine hydrolase [Sphingobium sp. SCG-1]|uniref:serine hydrolase domain-containing protein n=1 Tax=Sphingobium sp. SCG-1 TaxID=2072936 RepID=UPI000CD6C39B|nr:serine hydrolase domain-containing protein [Sphingobium sp. SCG-1]AUW58959.1 serine hydrolase [Sphingobium sp. SCG-1]
MKGITRNIRFGVAMLASALSIMPASIACAQQANKPTQSGGTRNLSQTVTPETVGFDSMRLKRLDAFMSAAVEQNRAAGITTLLARHGKIVSYKSHGYKNIEARTPMTKDAIFRLASMTKPVAAVAMLILFEEGRWQLDDPVSKYIPEFKNLRVVTKLDPNGKPVLEDAKHEPTIRELMTHTGGFSYGYGPTVGDKLASQSRVFEVNGSQDFINRVAGVPLAFQPGTSWTYSPGPEIQGVIIERMTGMTLGQFLEARIFKPLKMNDTGFFVPKDKASRLATVYQLNYEKKSLTPAAARFGAGDPTVPPQFESGGGGLYSTAMDYARFAQMLANKGELDGVRILSPAAIELMGTNLLPEGVYVNSNGQLGIGFFRLDKNTGFGMNVALSMDPLRSGLLEGKGTMVWGGATTTWWWYDPTNDVTFIMMTQLFGDMNDASLKDSARTLTYQALTNPER